MGIVISLLSVTKIEILRDCEAPQWRRIHEDCGCDCGTMEPNWLYAGEVLEEYQLYHTDISGLKLNEDYKILEVT